MEEGVKQQELFSALECIWSFVDDKNGNGWGEDEQNAISVIRAQMEGLPDSSIEANYELELKRPGDKITGHAPNIGQVTIRDRDKILKKRSEGEAQGSVYEAIGHWRVSRHEMTVVRFRHFWSGGTSRGNKQPMGLFIKFYSNESEWPITLYRDVALRLPGFRVSTQVPIWTSASFAWYERIMIWLWNRTNIHQS
ncbi:hypothetical protein CO174_00020 [Candidatus Uhrbacteria bacterium CG_4_9_14_3_um_filter_50_9]|uniref:Uncharacterized protein n=1 Tax=Candidatus Uhrbacteria bacterium CG_4_9_14_3_um_filter_50_9 TaxID=1975035 RepID=A0A2M7XES0_9BACT|nr:MAG: hypothetical protein CO174_00020 [Candidatus Uhrbacteria bacterium CG_4_9_14_3_um_filter_50_9]